MRSKNEGAAGKKKGGDDGGTKEKIVRRELQQVFTNGTIVDGEYLTSDDANHCVAIKVSLGFAARRDITDLLPGIHR
jgi:DNA mismatch repair protein MSH6